jgi:hypothetical protein
VATVAYEASQVRLRVNVQHDLPTHRFSLVRTLTAVVAGVFLVGAASVVIGAVCLIAGVTLLVRVVGRLGPKRAGSFADPVSIDGVVVEPATSDVGLRTS